MAEANFDPEYIRDKRSELKLALKRSGLEQERLQHLYALVNRFSLEQVLQLLVDYDHDEDIFLGNLAAYERIAPAVKVTPTKVQDPPTWEPDWKSNTCRTCDSAFTWYWRRHHCRACGNLVCLSCSWGKYALPHLGYDDKVRVCDTCVYNGQMLPPPEPSFDSDGEPASPSRLRRTTSATRRSELPPIAPSSSRGASSKSKRTRGESTGSRVAREDSEGRPVHRERRHRSSSSRKRSESESPAMRGRSESSRRRRHHDEPAEPEDARARAQRRAESAAPEKASAIGGLANAFQSAFARKARLAA